MPPLRIRCIVVQFIISKGYVFFKETFEKVSFDLQNFFCPKKVNFFLFGRFVNRPYEYNEFYLQYNINLIFFGDMCLEKYTYEIREFGQGVHAAHKFSASEQISKND